MDKTNQGEFKFNLTEKDLAEQLYVLLQDDFKGTIKVEGNKVLIDFTNGQRFTLEVKENG